MLTMWCHRLHYHGDAAADAGGGAASWWLYLCVPVRLLPVVTVVEQELMSVALAQVLLVEICVLLTRCKDRCG